MKGIIQVQGDGDSLLSKKACSILWYASVVSVSHLPKSVLKCCWPRLQSSDANIFILNNESLSILQGLQNHL